MKILFLMFLFLVACTKKHTPRAALVDFVNYRFSNSQSKDVLLSKVTGPLKEKIESIEGSELKGFLDTSGLEKKSLKILSENCEQDSCFITYIVSYLTMKDKEQTFLTEVKKIAEIRKLETGWKLYDVTNIKTFHDSKKAI